MPNFSYHFALFLGSVIRSSYQRLLPAIVRAPLRVAHPIPIEVFSYSGEAGLPEQVVSVRSFLRYAGRPRQYTIVSDGTYSQRSIDLLQAIDPCVQVTSTKRWMPAKLPTGILSYLTSDPHGQQLALIMSLPINGPALYVDSDVRFFRGASSLAQLAVDHAAPAYYLRDCQLSADCRLFRNETEKQDPANMGCLLLLEKLDWSIAIARFLELADKPLFFTNQTMTHLAMHANRALPFDPAGYVLQLDDQVVFADRYAERQIALRHYVRPVRHKLWVSLFA